MDPKSRDAIINSSLETQVSFIKQSLGENSAQAQALQEYAREEAKELSQTLVSTLDREQWSRIEFEMHKSLGRPDYTRKVGVGKTSQVTDSTRYVESPVQECKKLSDLTEEQVDAIFFSGYYSAYSRLSLGRKL